MCRGTLLCPSLLVQNLQACLKRRPGLHQAQEEGHPWLGDIPALRLCRRSVLQNTKRWQQVITESAHLPETMNEYSRNFLSQSSQRSDLMRDDDARLRGSRNGILCFSYIFLHQLCRVYKIVSQRNLNLAVNYCIIIL